MRILIVDDNREHGVIIKNALASAGFLAEFFHYDENFLSHLPTTNATRIIFSDLNLGGDGVEGAKNYAVVAAVLEQIITEDNGPYALVTWTTFSAQAQELDPYIRARLPEHCHPLVFDIINKEQFIKPGNTEQLKNKVLEMFEKFPAIRSVLEWESAAARAMTSVLNRLETIALINGAASFDKRLHQIFTKLAEAEGGPSAIAKEDITHPLISVLSRLLHDELASCAISALPAQKDENFAQFDPNRSRLNTMLHVQSPPPPRGDGGSLPGLVFSWPDDGIEPGIPPLGDRIEFSKRHFLKKNSGVEDTARCELVIVDVTPTCDHSQNNIPWRRFIGGLLIPHNLKQFSEASAEGAGRLCKLPVIMVDEVEVFLVLNSQLCFSVGNGHENLQRLGEPRFLLREQVYGDSLGWIGRQASRLGYTALAIK